MYETKTERDALFSASGKYTEVQMLNETPTGFGWAVLMHDIFNKPCVAKLPNSQAATFELRNEAEILAKIRELEHPNLVQLRDVEKCQVTWHGDTDERLFIVLQYGGKNLRSRLGKLGVRRTKEGDEYVYLGGNSMGLDEFFHIAIQVADGLRALHEFELEPGEHIVHRDIKPENILIDKDARVRITDFGISRVVERLTQSFTVGGTPPYLAPEYLRGRINASCDIYSFGIILYEMVTGSYPFKCQEDKLWELPTPPHKINPDFPEQLSQVILRALDWDPHAPRGSETRNRYQTGGQILEDLKKCKQRLFPVPANFERILGAPTDRHLYRDRHDQKTVRVLIYDVPRRELAMYRLAALVALKLQHLVLPQRLFDGEGLVGIVAPLVPWDAVTETSLDTVTGTSSRPSQPASRAPQRKRPVLPERVQERSAQQALHSLASLANILSSLHQIGICHGCLSPFNAVLIDGRWMVDDTWVGALVGSCDLYQVFTTDDPVLACLAPEMAGWQTSAKVATDVYGLGTLAYAALTGQLPGLPATLGPTGTALPRTNELNWPDDIPERWRQIVERALSPLPEQRQRTMEELAADFLSCNWSEDWLRSVMDQVRRQHAAGQVVEAYDALDAAQLRDPGSPAVHHVRAELFLTDDSPDYALTENTAAYNIEPTPEVCYLQARCCLALTRPAEAEKYIREGLTYRDGVDGRLLLAQCLESLGRQAEADEERKAAAKLATPISGPLR